MLTPALARIKSVDLVRVSVAFVVSVTLADLSLGLNAAANHGYIPRAGYMTIVETIDGLGAAYG